MVNVSLARNLIVYLTNQEIASLSSGWRIVRNDSFWEVAKEMSLRVRPGRAKQSHIEKINRKLIK